jgi:hypothetical protein
VIRHVVVFRWREGVEDSAVQAARDGLTALPDLVPTIRAFAFGDDIGVNTGNADLAVTVDFDDTDGYVAYRDHPDHQALVRDRIAPILAERLAVQFSV